MEVAIKDITLGKRHRKDLGDIAALAKSIEDIGLLHPVVLTPENRLIVGQRRIEAFKKLGRANIPARIARDLTEVARLLQAEADENTCRKDFSPDEAVAVGLAIERAVRPEKVKARREGGETGGKTAGKSRPSDRDGGSSPKALRDEGSRTTAVAAAAVGMDRRTYEKAKEVVSSGDSALIAEMAKSGKVNGAHKKLRVRSQAAQIAAEPPPLPEGPFRVIVIDPPWAYSNRPDDPSHRAANPYPSMGLDEIKALAVAERAHTDSVLWLWTTNAHIRHAFAIAEAWGFAYKTLLTWIKDKMGTGDWLRGKTEHCLLCVRGKPTIVLTNETTALNGPMRKHSQKPEEFYAMVEKLCPGSKLEMFARETREGWTAWGDEAK